MTRDAHLIAIFPTRNNIDLTPEVMTYHIYLIYLVINYMTIPLQIQSETFSIIFQRHENSTIVGAFG